MSRGFPIVGLVVASAGPALVSFPFLGDIINIPGPSLADASRYPAFLVVKTFLLEAGKWAIKSIESLFHYRRVNELVFITMAAHVARKTVPPRPMQTSRPSTDR